MCVCTLHDMCVCIEYDMCVCTQYDMCVCIEYDTLTCVYVLNMTQAASTELDRQVIDIVSRKRPR